MMHHKLKPMLSPYYIVNVLMCVSYVSLRTLPSVCDYLFTYEEEPCHLTYGECNVFLLLGCVVVIKNRREPSWTQYLERFFRFTKVANVYLFIGADPRLGALYVVLLLVSALVFPQPSADSGPDEIVYFRGHESLEEELRRDRRVTWLVAFYAAWSPACVAFAPVFSKLSVDYHHDFIKFGKFEVGTSPELAKKLSIDTSSLSKQLPTVVMFQNTKETKRAPWWEKGKIAKLSLTEANLIAHFNLNNLQLEMKRLHKTKKAENQNTKPKTE